MKPENLDRDNDIRAMRARGATLFEIGEKYELSRERVRQICLRYVVAPPIDPESWRAGRALDQISITELRLTNRAYNAMNVAGVTTVAELAKLTDAELLRTPNVGRVTLGVIDDALREAGVDRARRRAPGAAPGD